MSSLVTDDLYIFRWQSQETESIKFPAVLYVIYILPGHPETPCTALSDPWGQLGRIYRVTALLFLFSKPSKRSPGTLGGWINGFLGHIKWYPRNGWAHKRTPTPPTSTKTLHVYFSCYSQNAIKYEEFSPWHSYQLSAQKIFIITGWNRILDLNSIKV